MADHKLTSVVVLIQKPPFFDAITGDPKPPFEQCFEPRFEWPNFIKNSLGYKVQEILHLPDGAKTPEEILKGK